VSHPLRWSGASLCIAAAKKRVETIISMLEIKSKTMARIGMTAGHATFTGIGLDEMAERDPKLDQRVVKFEKFVFGPWKLMDC